MTVFHVLSVFVGPHGASGNPLGVFLDGAAIPASERQPIAARLGFSETVFVDDPATGELAIFTPATELPFAGHPLVGAAWLLAEQGQAPPQTLRPHAGEVSARQEGELTFIAGRPEWAPPFALLQQTRRPPSTRSPARRPAATSQAAGPGRTRRAGSCAPASFR